MVPRHPPRLPASDRTLFALVNEATLANPFGERRASLDRQMATLAPASGPPAARPAAIARVAERVARLEAEGRARPSAWAEPDRELVSLTLLFDAFHRYVPAFDAHIAAQHRGGDESAAVPFAREALALLARRGFGPEEGRRYFAFFYQLRRAFFFVDRALVGRSASMRALRERLWRNVFTDDLRTYVLHLWNRMEDFSTLLLGETGTGKGAAAAALGRSGFIPFDERRGAFSVSFTRGFLAINLSQYPETLIESELFGHRKGAFTGAIEQHEGVFARGSPHGAIFLDEIGDVSGPVQIKLLQVLQERTFSAVGSHERQRFSGRVIAATNRPLDRLRREGRLRDDFYYRLSSDVVLVPPLRQRLAEHPGELELLVASVLGRLAGDAASDLAPRVLEALDRGVGRGYAWPGNVRELEQAVRRILVDGRYTGEAASAGAGWPERLARGIEAGTLDAATLVGGYCALLHERHRTYEEVARRTGLDRRTVK
ncbi:MAG TPA: sigma 54-interacting transcriptional regulator, partial [Vicinamibacteria bacterium]